MSLLVRREHSRFELLGKLTRRGFDGGACEGVLDELITENALSDERFAELYVNYRRERGFGPLRIGEELRKRGVGDALRAAFCSPTDADWTARVQALRRRRFGDEAPLDFHERARQTRFLTQRGFTGAQVSAAF
ncbi:MAG: regulatory protein [Gammaproteobacteria bacterium]|jgi:regulatory protein